MVLSHSSQIRSTQPETPYWHTYYSREIINRVNSLMHEYYIPSQSLRLYTCVYEQRDPNAPVFIWNHGGGGYSGIFHGLALAFYDAGYTVVMADYKGHGRTGTGTAKGDWTIDAIATNIKDVVIWVQQKYKGKIFMGSGSIGTGFTYNAIALGAKVDAVATLQFYGFDDPATALRLSKFAFLANVPLLPKLMAQSKKFFARFASKLRLPYLAIAHWDNMLDERDKAKGFVAKWKQDPYTPRTITLEAFASLQNTPPAIPLQENTMPWLVINTMRDTMVHPQVTKDTYTRLGGPKHYVEMDWGHFSQYPEFMTEFVQHCNVFFKNSVKR